MNSPPFSAMHLAKPPLDRRTFLRAAGVGLALPMLESMRPLFGASSPEIPRRMVCIQTNMGILPQFFFPEAEGRDYPLSPYLERLAAHRDRFTVFSGLSFPGVDGGHAAEKCFLTATPHPGRGGFRNGISLDQLAAEQVGNQTRHPSLCLSVPGGGGSQTLSFTRGGAPIPPESSPRKLFEKLFLQGKPEEVAAAVENLRRGRSLMDFLGEQSRRLHPAISTRDAAQLDQYFTAVRELEQRLHAAEDWEHRPKPLVDATPPEDVTDALAFARRTELTFGVLKLALETDSTRIVSLFIDTTVIHNITHHGNRPDVLEELRGHEQRQFDALNGFLDALAVTREEGDSLLDRTQVLYGSCMGSANSHSNLNLPVLLAGGGFRHGQHLAFDRSRNENLAGLYVTMLQRLGIGADAFSTGSGTLRGLEMT